MRVDLQGQVALVTGAAQGIGRAIADALAANGARVAYTDLHLGRCREAAEVAPVAEARHFAYSLDVSDGAQIDAVVGEIARAAGRIDILVNNAGIGVKAEDRRPIDEFPIET